MERLVIKEEEDTEHGNVNPPPTWGYLEIFLLGLEGVHLFALFYLLTPVLTNQFINKPLYQYKHCFR